MTGAVETPVALSGGSKIEWTDSTFNPWWGCVRVSAACQSCYAEAFAKRFGMKVWGKNAERRLFGDKHWREPVLWNRQAAAAGERRRVFCASMADVFEDLDALDEQRTRLWDLIGQTPWLDWLLLTKRPEQIMAKVPAAWGVAGGWPANVWAGTTVEEQWPCRSAHPVAAGGAGQREVLVVRAAVGADRVGLGRDPLGDRRRRERSSTTSDGPRLGEVAARAISNGGSCLLL